MIAFAATLSTLALSALISNAAAASPVVAPSALTVLRPPTFSLAAFPPPDDPPPQPSNPAGSPSEPVKVRKRPFLAAAEVAALNLGVWAFVHYVGDAFYSYISMETMSENFRDGWEWDRSMYVVNFYHHPYHGYLYYSAGRANGLGYWGSCLAALGGSLMWETVMEKNRGSYNDLITTTCGGIVYGEIGHRFSGLVRRSGARGLERIWRETVGAILDPVGGLNRLLNGREDNDPSLPGCPDTGHILNGELVVTGPVVTRSGELTGTKAAPILGFTLHYGDPAGTGWAGKPFDIFRVKGRLRWGPDRPHLTLFIHGALAGKELAAPNGGSHFLGVYQHYEYYGFDTMRVCGTSFTGGWNARFIPAKNVHLTTGARLGWLGLGSSDDFLATDLERRNYNLGTGWTAAAEAGVAIGGFEYFSVCWRHYGLYDLRVTGSRPGRESWDIVLGQLEVPVWKRFGLGLTVEYCGRSYDFEDSGPGSRRLFEARAFLAWQF